MHGRKVPWNRLHEIVTKYEQGCEHVLDRLTLESAVTSPLTFPTSVGLWPRPPPKLTKTACLCAKPACWANPDASMPPNAPCDYTWALVPFVISRGSHRGLLPKRDELVESTHTVGLVFWGSCSHSFSYCALSRPPGLKAEGLSRLPLQISRAALGSDDTRGTSRHPEASLLWPSRKVVYKCKHPEQQTFFFFFL